MATGQPSVRWSGLYHRPGERELFHGWSAEAPPGVTWLGGDEGTGKTTLLRLLAGEIAPDAGSVAFDLAPPGLDRTEPPPVFWVDPRTTRHNDLTTREALAQVLAPFQGGDAAELQRLWLALDLAPHLDKALYMLSAGSRRKVWLLAAVASGAPVVLLDQPFAALDLVSERALRAELQGIATRADRVVIVADYTPPPGVPLAARLDLDPLADLVNRAHP
jgi:ABC-type multidrug transport system ATPase subunit